MKNLYKKKAWCLDEDVLVEGYIDKYGFHANSLACGWNLQLVKKKMINKTIFYDLEKAKKILGNLEVVS